MSLVDEAVVELTADVVVVVAVAVSVVVLEAVDVVDVVLVDESLDREEQTLEKPLANSYTFTSRPLVGTVRVQSGGLSEMIDSMRDWQFVDAHIRAYSASVGSEVEYRRL
ncbi:hypothetical protein L916_07233 [Phytophthora nicotianae]|uniref:Uncharacterized protein n=1 Tax=Phytophthora nicotianae TaxID=4792 RepID=W2J649_PHYNI|nr:hypothetical protein L916_07233 [Phytophthora nicotianae]